MDETKPPAGRSIESRAIAPASAAACAAPAPRWPLPPARPDLGDDEIHVWCAALDGLASDLPSFAGTLSGGERDRAARFQFDRDRDRFIVRRGLLRRILGRYLNLDPAQLAFTSEPRGKPALAGIVGGKMLHFNLSHSDGLALFALARRPNLGVDVERLRPMPDMDRLAAQFFSTRENDRFNALPAEQRLEAFFHCWTRKEAYLKATGEGIADALPRIEVSLAPGQPARLLSIAGDAQAAAWSLHSLAPAPGFIGALAIRSLGLKAVCWRWPG